MAFFKSLFLSDAVFRNDGNDGNSPGGNRRSFSAQSSKVNSEIRAIPSDQVNTQRFFLHHVLLADIYKAAKLCDTCPARVEQIAEGGTENHVHATAVGNFE